MFWDGNNWAETPRGTVITSNVSAAESRMPLQKAAVFFRGNTGKLCRVLSVAGSPWNFESDCSSGEFVSGVLGALSADEVVDMGTGKASDMQRASPSRIYIH